MNGKARNTIDIYHIVQSNAYGEKSVRDEPKNQKNVPLTQGWCSWCVIFLGPLAIHPNRSHDKSPTNPQHLAELRVNHSTRLTTQPMMSSLFEMVHQ